MHVINISTTKKVRNQKFRLIHDGTHYTLVNNTIRVRDQQRSPMIQDISAELHEQEESGLTDVTVT